MKLEKAESSKYNTNHSNAVPFLGVKLANVALIYLGPEHDEAQPAARQQHCDLDAAAAVEVPQLVAHQGAKGDAAAAVAIAH